jgi:poly-gamma-glutamate synthesis protein (capsule biosynthesis protein)
MGSVQQVFLILVAAFMPIFGLLNGANITAHGAPLKTVPTATVLFGGDMMFDRTVRSAADKSGGDYLFSCLDPLFSQADLVVANLEGPITEHASVSLGSAIGAPDNFTFTFPTSTAMLLAKHGVKLVNLGNNHIFNFKLDGVLSTEHYLDAAGVGHFGDPDKAEADRVARIEINGIPFSFVNWSDWTSDNTDHTVQQIALEKASGRLVVVYTHWGEEYVPPPDRVKTLAHQFVDAGADIVIGSHPHIVQEHELYHGKYIYYSLGNLIFDQYWDDAVSHGLMLSVSFSADGVHSVREIPVELLKDRRTCPVGATAIE